MNLNRFSKIENNKKNLKSGDLFFMCYLEILLFEKSEKKIFIFGVEVFI